jgi:hypothetical protein
MLLEAYLLNGAPKGEAWELAVFRALEVLSPEAAELLTAKGPSSALGLFWEREAAE